MIVLLVIGAVLLSPLLVVAIAAGLGIVIFATCVGPVLALMSPLGVALYEGVALRPRRHRDARSLKRVHVAAIHHSWGSAHQ